ncbi:unnamed protein product, partial [Candidula unifasciata]
MDEKEQADRLAAAEALYMISTRVDKSGGVEKSPRISRKKRNNDHVEERSGKRKVVGNDGERAGRGRRGRTRSNSGGGGTRGVGENRGSGSAGSRGRGGRGGGSSPKGRGAAGKAVKSQQRQIVSESEAIISTHETFKGHNNNNGRCNKHTVIISENILPQSHNDQLKQKSKGRTQKVRQKTKSKPPPIAYVGYSQVKDDNIGKVHQAIGLTGAAISLNDPLSSRSSFESSQALQSHGLVSGLKQ